MLKKKSTTKLNLKPELIKEMMDHHRKLKMDILNLVERANTPNYTKDRLKEELFKIYMEMK